MDLELILGIASSSCSTVLPFCSLHQPRVEVPSPYSVVREVMLREWWWLWSSLALLCAEGTLAWAESALTADVLGLLWMALCYKSCQKQKGTCSNLCWGLKACLLPCTPQCWKAKVSGTCDWVLSAMEMRQTKSHYCCSSPSSSQKLMWIIKISKAKIMTHIITVAVLIYFMKAIIGI